MESATSNEQWASETHAPWKGAAGGYNARREGHLVRRKDPNIQLDSSAQIYDVVTEHRLNPSVLA